MTKEATSVLTRENSLESFVSPQGRKYGVVKDKVYPSLFKISLVDGRPGALPEELGGNFTKQTLAEEKLKSFLIKAWDISDKAAGK
jgi:hypothetical protein